MALPDDLLSPAAYPEPAPGGVELETTHGSWVFLAGPDVYKVKRPVNCGSEGPSVSDAGEELLDRFQASAEPVGDLPAGEHVVVDTSGEPGRARLAAVLERLPG